MEIVPAHDIQFKSVKELSVPIPPTNPISKFTYRQPEQYQNHIYMPALPPNELEYENNENEFVTYHNTIPEVSPPHESFSFSQNYNSKPTSTSYRVNEGQRYFGKPDQSYESHSTFRRPSYSQNSIDYSPTPKIQYSNKGRNFNQVYPGPLPLEFSGQNQNSYDSYKYTSTSKPSTKFNFPTTSYRPPSPNRFDFGGYSPKPSGFVSGPPSFPTPRPSGNPYFEVKPSMPLIRISNPENAIPKGSGSSHRPSAVIRDNSGSGSSLHYNTQEPYAKNHNHYNRNHANVNDVRERMLSATSSNYEKIASMTRDDLLLRDLMETIFRGHL